MIANPPIIVLTPDDLSLIRHYFERERLVIEQGITMIGLSITPASPQDPLVEDYRIHQRLQNVARDLLDYIDTTIDTYAGAVLEHTQFLSFLRIVLDAVGRRKVLNFSFLDRLDTPEFSSAIACRQPVVLRLTDNSPP